MRPIPPPLKLAANLSFLYQEYEFLDRFNAAAADGFSGVEYLFPYDWPAKKLSGLLNEHGLRQILFNLQPGDWTKGDRGLASLPDRESDFTNSVYKALDYAAELNCTHLHVMSGIKQKDISASKQTDHFAQSLTKALELAKPYNITLLIEPINNHDMPGYFLNDFDFAADIINTIGSDHLGLQFDIYHCQKIHGNIAARLEQLISITRHIQIANPPNRSEPNVGEINYPYLFNLLQRLNYSGWMGCEYIPSSTTSQTLDWASGSLHVKY